MISIRQCSAKDEVQAHVSQNLNAIVYIVNTPSKQQIPRSDRMFWRGL